MLPALSFRITLAVYMRIFSARSSDKILIAVSGSNVFGWQVFRFDDKLPPLNLYLKPFS